MKHQPHCTLLYRHCDHGRLAASLTLLAILIGIHASPAATIPWNGASGTDTNWSTAGNWIGGVAAADGDDVKFFDAGTNTPGVVSSVVDASLAIGSLHYAGSNGVHTTLIASGQTLNITNTGGLFVFSPADLGAARNMTNTITGVGGTLNVSNSAAIISLNQANNVSANNRASLNLTGLDNFNATVSRIGLGSTVFPNVIAQRCGGQLILARTNFITLTYSDTLANYMTAGKTNAIEFSRNPGNNPGTTSILLLGQTNVIYLDSISCGLDKSGNNSTAASGVLAFNPAFTNSSPVAYFRGKNGGVTDRVTWWSIGDGNSSSSSSNGGRGTNDFTHGTVDLLVDTMSLARECDAANTGWAGPHSGVLTFTAGTIDANTIYAGNEAFASRTTSTPGCVGTINVNGAGALLKVNTSLVLGRTTGTSVTALRTSGILNIQQGTVQANDISVGATGTNNLITINGGTLVVSNGVGSPAKGLTAFTLTNSTLGLHITGITNIATTNLITGGATNIINPITVGVFASYPAQIKLIKYTTLGGAGFNFGFGANVLPASAPGAYLSNNIADKSIDLVLPTDPRPVITSVPNNFASAPGVDVTLTAAYTGVAPLTAQWRKDGVDLADGPTGNGSTLAGVATASLNITNAQELDSGSYVIVVTNIFGSVTSTPAASITISTSDIAPIVTGPANKTVIQGNNATFTASVSGNPAPYIQWQKNGADILGENSSALTIANAQYPDDQATYSIVATNIAGSLTNSATLTVIVPPVITLQPVSLVVTNTEPASFTAAATGVPTPGYKWLKNGSPITDVGNISGSSTATLSFSAVTAADIGNYSVTITNQAGTTNSVTVSLTVNSLMTTTGVSPNNAATGVFYDTPLAITFSQPPTLRTAGTIKIYNVTNSTTPVDTINLSLGNAQQRTFPGDNQSFTYNVVTLNGNTATIYPHFNVMTSNQTYYVTVDNGVFADPAGAYFAGITETNAWQFTTKAGGAASPTNIVVAANGSGDFLTVQGAVNSIASGNTTPTLINIRNGDYNEIVNIAARHNVTFRGQSRGGVVVGYANNATFQVANSGTTHARMAFKVGANDIAIENMTVTNRTPVGGSQAEALMIETGARRFILHNATVSSFQDTILANQNSSEGYFYNSLVQGQFDYIWGGGRLFFTNCEIKTLVGAGGALNTGNVTASRTDLAGTNGFSFMRCQFTRIIPTITNTTLAGNNGSAGGNAAFISCNFSDNYTNPSAAIISSQILWEFGNSNANNTLPRTFGLTVLTEGDGRLTAARTADIWLNGWVPQLAPNILSQPTNLTVNANASAAFNVVATGISDPTYQWLKDGTNLVGQTGATLTLPNASGYDIGSYSVIVSNAAGTVISSTATLSVNQPAAGPDLAATTVLGNGNVQFSISGPAGSAGFSYRVWASTNLALAPVTSTWVLLTNDVFGFSPTVFTDTDAGGLPQRFYIITVP